MRDLEKVRANSRKWNHAHRELRALRERERRARPGYVAPKRVQPYYKRDNAKEYAKSFIKRAVRYGRIVRPTECSLCHKTCKPHGHHPDYSKPSEVIWLCTRCHMRTHGRYGL